MKGIIITTFLSCAIYTGAASTASSTTTPIENIQSESHPASKYFLDNCFSMLKNKMKERKLSSIENPFIRNAALQMLNGTYAYTYRVQEYKAYPNPAEEQKYFKTGAYSYFDNPTGISFEQGEDVVIAVSDTQNALISLRIHNFGKEGGDSVYELKPGLNTFKAANKGLAYIQYFTPMYAQAPKIKINIMTGSVNGFFDTSKSNADWQSLLSSAQSDVIDIVGDRVHLVYSVASLKQYCPDKGRELIGIYDSIIAIQQDLMGYNLQGRKPANRMLGRVVWDGYMYADELGAAFHEDTMGELADVSKVKSNVWGIAHEFGHVNQVHPNLCWTGTTEVTNNIFSAWTQYLFTPNALRLEHEKLKGYTLDQTGERFNTYFESALIRNEEWLTQAGPDRWDRFNGKDWGGDHFVKLCPLWQLQLFFGVAGKGNTWATPSLYPNLFALSREDSNTQSSGRSQLLFVKRICDISRRDMTDFFVRTGFLRPIDKCIDDYTPGQHIITQAQIDDLIAYAKRYKKPESPVIYYISGNSIDAFRRMKKIEGTHGKGYTITDGKMIIDHDAWKNVVAFEIYTHRNLRKIVMVGSGSNDNSFTALPYLPDATRVEAIAWNGKRRLVYGSR